jgi:hypothetical protein
MIIICLIKIILKHRFNHYDKINTLIYIALIISNFWKYLRLKKIRFKIKKCAFYRQLKINKMTHRKIVI